MTVKGTVCGISGPVGVLREPDAISIALTSSFRMQTAPEARAWRRSFEASIHARPQARQSIPYKTNFVRARRHDDAPT